MANYATANIRTVALVGQGGSGKTTLAEALLLTSGAIKEAGTVERGTTVSDFDPLEKILAALAARVDRSTSTRRTRAIHLIDTPGFPDFIGQAIGALDAVETAAVVVNAQSGIEMIASRMMDWAAKRRLCRLVIVNKIDAENVDLPAAARVDPGGVRQGVPADQPAGRRRQAGRRLLLQSRRRIRFLVGRRRAPRARRPGRRGRRGADGDLPRAGRDRAGAAARAVREGAARRPPRAGLLRLGEDRRRRRRAARRARQARAESGRGQSAALLQGRGRRGRRNSARSPIRRSTCSRTCSRSSSIRSSASSASSACTRERSPRTRSSSSATAASRSRSGISSCCRAARTSRSTARCPATSPRWRRSTRSSSTACCTTRTTRTTSTCGRSSFRCRCTGVAITPKKRGDEQRISDVLHRMIAEDPTIVVEHDATTNETVLRALGDLHLRSMLERMASAVQARDRHAAAAHSVSRDDHRRRPRASTGTRSRPAARASSAKCRCASSRASAARASSSSTRPRAASSRTSSCRRCRRASSRCWRTGAVAGFPMQDVRVIVYDGKHHPVDSKEVAFVSAGKKAFLDAIEKARPIVLEPIVSVEIICPEAQHRRHRRRPVVAARPGHRHDAACSRACSRSPASRRWSSSKATRRGSSR